MKLFKDIKGEIPATKEGDKIALLRLDKDDIILTQPVLAKRPSLSDIDDIVFNDGEYFDSIPVENAKHAVEVLRKMQHEPSLRKIIEELLEQLEQYEKLVAKANEQSL